MSQGGKQGVGVFLIGGFVLFAVGLFLIGDRRQMFSDNVTLYAEFRDLAGLENGATVRVGGMAAGEVTAIALPPGPESPFKVEFRILEDLTPIVRGDSRASIQVDGIVGNKFLQIDAGSRQAPQAESGDTLPSEEPFEFSDLIEEARGIADIAAQTIEDVKGDIEVVVQNINDVADQAEGTIADVRPQVRIIARSAANISERADAIITGVEQGKGTVGKLFNDEELYQDIRGAADNFKAVAQNAEKTSEGVSRLIAEAEERQVIKKVDETVANVRDVTASAKEALQSLQPEEGDGPGLMDEVKMTLTNANETMSDFSENSEALKRNFLLRGFFKRRGFFDIDEIAVDEYKEGVASPGVEVGREWLHTQDLFEGEPGSEKLTDDGRAAIDRAVSSFLESSRTDPILVEGYAQADNAAEAFRLSHRRAAIVRQYLISEYQLTPTYIGVIEMGEVASRAQDEKPWDGVALVQFVSRKEMKKREKARRGAN